MTSAAVTRASIAPCPTLRVDSIRRSSAAAAHLEEAVIHRISTTCVAILLLTGSFAISASALPTFDFVFTGRCDDCAFNGDPQDLGFDPFGDGLFETVTGTLRLTDVTPDANGLIQVDSNNFDSFTYGGSSLINGFTFDDAFTIQGLLDPSGQVQPQEALLLNTSDGPGGPFSFPDFCTPLGIEALRCEGQIGLVSFVLDSTGSWSVSGTEPFDVGIGGQLAPAAVPEASSLAMLSLGLGIGIARRRRGRARTS